MSKPMKTGKIAGQKQKRKSSQWQCNMICLGCPANACEMAIRGAMYKTKAEQQEKLQK